MERLLKTETQTETQNDLSVKPLVPLEDSAEL